MERDIQEKTKLYKKIVENLPKEMAKYNITSLREIIGGAH
mgnify:CR=1 FL=1